MAHKDFHFPQKAIVEKGFSTVTYASNIAPDFCDQKIIVTLTGDLTIDAAVNASSSKSVMLIKIIQDGTGSHAVTWNASYKFSGGTAPTMTVTASKYDMYTVIYDGTNYSVSGVQDF